MNFRLRNSRDRSFYSLTGLIKQVGRSVNCDIVIADPQVSRLHARMEKSESGWAVVDLESQNGTMVNGVKVREKELKPGDVIHFGGACFIYEVEDVADDSEESTKIEQEFHDSPGLLERILGGKKKT